MASLTVQDVSAPSECQVLPSTPLGMAYPPGGLYPIYTHSYSAIRIYLPSSVAAGGGGERLACSHASYSVQG